MPKERKKSLCMDTLRHAEYYGMLQTFDDLYAKSKSGEKFPNLMELILSQDNIMLAYRILATLVNCRRRWLLKKSEKSSQEASTAIGQNL